MKNKNEKPLKRAANNAAAADALSYFVTPKSVQQAFCRTGFLTFVFCVLFVLSPALSAFSAELQKKVLVIPVENDIEDGLSFFVQRQLRRAEADNYAAAVLEINSNGGKVTSSQEIKDALLKSKVVTAAYVKGRALSAAALIAISCNKIFMRPGSELGAATPIMLGGKGVKAAEPKFVAAFKAEFKASAEARRRPVSIAEAMVDKDHNTIEGISKRGEIVALTTESALQCGYCDQVVSSLESVLRAMALSDAKVEHTKPTSAELIARYLTNPQLSPILFSAGVWCLIAEFFVAGFGVLGISGLVLLALFFGGHLFAYLAGFEAILLFVVGLILLALEIFVIPGFGITGICGILAVSTSVIIVFGGVYGAVEAIMQIIAYSAVFTFLLYKLAPKCGLFERFILKNDLSVQDGYVAVSVNEYDDLLNLEGITASQCRPSGKIKIGDKRYDAVSDGEFIEKGTRIIVKKVEGQNIIISRIKS